MLLENSVPIVTVQKKKRIEFRYKMQLGSDNYGELFYVNKYLEGYFKVVWEMVQFFFAFLKLRSVSMLWTLQHFLSFLAAAC